MKLIDEFNMLEHRRKQDAKAIVARRVPSPPSSIFKIGGAGKGYEPEEWSVEDLSMITFVKGTWFNKKPTKAIVAILREAPPLAEDGEIFLHTKRGNVSTGDKLSDAGKLWFYSLDEAEKASREIKEKYVAKEGQFNCAYCRYATDNSKKVTRRIISRGYPGGGMEFDHCSTECAGYNQMGHEG